MKKKTLLLRNISGKFLTGVALGILFFSLSSTKTLGADLIFDPNGADKYFFTTGIYEYTLDANEDQWTTSTTGQGTLQKWTPGNTLTFDLRDPDGKGTDTSAIINLTYDMEASGIKRNGGSLTSGNSLTLRADSKQTITFSEGAEINVNFGGSRYFIIGDNVNIIGDFSLTGNSYVRYEGSGDEYEGTITLAGGNLYIGSAAQTANKENRFGINTKIKFDESGVFFINGTTTIGELSGVGGDIRRGSVTTGNVITLNQSTITEWDGKMGIIDSNGKSVAEMTFIKDGSGTLSLTGDETHYVKTTQIAEGSLYIKSEVNNISNGTISVDADANLGGTLLSGKQVILTAEEAILSPGMLASDGTQGVGTMTLNNGLEAKSGGHFVFALNGETGNSKLILSGGALSITGGTTFHISLLDKGFGEPDLETPITLFSMEGTATGDLAAFMALWELDGTAPSFVDANNPFLLVGNTIQLNLIPEPSTGLLLFIGLFGILLVINRRRSAASA